MTTMRGLLRTFTMVILSYRFPFAICNREDDAKIRTIGAPNDFSNARDTLSAMTSVLGANPRSLAIEVTPE